MENYEDCPECGCEMIFDSIDENGTYYVCTNCGHQLIDDSMRSDEENDEDY
jgi:predicted RNA-binding Zn-ribbon protein involved in translation (DUF1610 family)